MKITEEELNDISKIIYLKNSYGLNPSDIKQIILKYEEEKAKIIAVQPDVIKVCTCLPSETEWHDIIQRYCRKCEARIIG